MLKRAAETYKPSASPAEPRTLSQQAFSNASASVQQSVQKQHPLNPTSSSTLNGRSNTITGAFKNPLKRTASQASGMSRSYSTTGSGGSASQSGVLGQLHQSVYFEENDFIDDADLDFDDESPIQPSLPPTSKPPVVQSSARAPTTSTPTRTSQITWSSSPLEHKATPPKAHLLQRTKAPTVDLTQDVPKTIEEEEPIRPVKRRHLPWVEPPQSHYGQNPRVTTDGASDPKASLHRFKHVPNMTPVSKARQDATPAWNKTASAIKEEQRRHRQQKSTTKAMVKDVPADKASVAKASTRNKKVARVFLSEEQKKVLGLVMEQKKSVFFTGSAGTGKSVLMREIIQALKQKYQREPDKVAVTASTGLAACNIGGVTLHSFAGIGLGKEPVEQLVKKIKRNAKTKQRWQKVKYLVIDEISMVDGDLFDKLEQCARILRGSGRPFGGIQLVVTGDFFQLPPVPDSGRAAKFSFEAATWPTSIQHTIGLTHVYRQKDQEFAAMLNEMRLGKLSPASIAKFRALCRAPKDDFIDATSLFPTRGEVASANASRMRLLGGTTFDYGAQDGGTITDIDQRTRLLANCMAEQQITLKVGAQVMLIKNIDESLVNGSIGRVVAFMDEKTYDVYHESPDDDPAFADIGKFSQDPADGRSKLQSFVNKDLAASTSQKWPLVRFKQLDGTSRDLLCQRESWKIELPNGEVQASRNQIPLILAWALSIHKAQGQTLEHVRVDLQKVFEKGQAYVALSRATTREGLQILNFDPKRVQAHPRVSTFYDKLYNIDKAMAGGVTEVHMHGRTRQPAEISDFFDDDENAMNDAAYY